MTKHDNVSQEGIMKATEFVKKFGWERAKREVALIGTIAVITGDRNWLSDLKRLVESHEILGLFKSLDQAKADVAACEYAGHADLLVKLDCGIGYINTARVKQAIADVEACHEVN